MAIGELGEAERVLLAVLELDHDAALVRVDRDHAGGVPVERSGAAVVAGELDAVAGAQLLLDLDERLGLVASPSGG